MMFRLTVTGGSMGEISTAAGDTFVDRRNACSTRETIGPWRTTLLCTTIRFKKTYLVLGPFFVPNNTRIRHDNEPPNNVQLTALCIPTPCMGNESKGGVSDIRRVNRGRAGRGVRHP